MSAQARQKAMGPAVGFSKNVRFVIKATAAVLANILAAIQGASVHQFYGSFINIYQSGGHLLIAG